MLRIIAIATLVLLTSCIAALEGAAIEGVAARAAMGGVAVEGAAGIAAADAMAASRLMIAAEVAANGEFSSALGQVAAGRAALLIDEGGYIRIGANRVASLQGQTFFGNGRAIATLQDGVLYREGGAVPVGRFRGAIPGNSVELQYTTGMSAPNLRAMLVDVLKLENGRYLVRLASGEEAWVSANALSLGLLGLAVETDCQPYRGSGVLVRVTGEPVKFDRCERRDDVVMLTTLNGPVAIDAGEVHEVYYGPSEVQFAATVDRRA